MTIRQRQSDASGSNRITDQVNVSTSQDNEFRGALWAVPAVLDLYTVLSLVFGGCCSNVLIYEQLLTLNPSIGSALTFFQMLFVTLQTLPSFISFSKSWIPELKPRQVPLQQWALQVLVLTSGSLLNNWAFAYKVPLTILIVIRSAGLPMSMLFGYLLTAKRYTHYQILSVMLVFTGVITVTLSKSGTSSHSLTLNSMAPEDLQKYLYGVAMMIISLLCTGVLGFLQERTYLKYGPCWKEALFYTHSLSLPAFAFLRNDIKQGILGLSEASSEFSIKSFALLLANLVTQFMCVSGVNRLSSQVSSVSTHIALTMRKAISLCLSVWLFGNDWNPQLGVGACMVFVGSFLYALGTKSRTSIKRD